MAGVGNERQLRGGVRHSPGSRGCRVQGHSDPGSRAAGNLRQEVLEHVALAGGARYLVVAHHCELLVYSFGELPEQVGYAAPIAELTTSAPVRWRGHRIGDVLPRAIVVLDNGSVAEVFVGEPGRGEGCNVLMCQHDTKPVVE